MSDDDDRPPILGTWANLYGLVLGALALTIGILWVIGRVYAP